MRPRVKDVLDLVDRLAPPSMAEEWDNPGLQLGAFSSQVRKVLLALDPTCEAVKETVRRNAQLLLTHHPLIFRPISMIDIETPPGRVILQALEKGISIASTHTNLDVVQGGMNDILAGLFDLREVTVLKKREKGPSSAGLGRIGYLRKPLRLHTMVEKVKTILRTQNVKVVGEKSARVRRVAVVGGSGGSMVLSSSKEGADLLITGDIGHHAALEARALGLAVIDGGHFLTEKAGLPVFRDHLKKEIQSKDWDVQIEIFERETDPARYA